MIRKLLTSFILSVMITPAFAAQEEPRFVLLPNVNTQYLQATNAEKAISIENRVIDLVKKVLNITPASPYKTVRLRLIYNQQYQIQSIIVYLLSSKYKSIELVRIDLNSDFTVMQITRNYELQPDDLKQSPHYVYQSKEIPICPDESVQFVIGNNFKGDESVEKEVQKVYQLAKKKGYNPFLMDINDPKGPQPTVQAYENWLSCPHVKGFYNESHGSTRLIVLADDDFSYSLIEKELSNKLNHEVILFDSCLTFNSPILQSMTDMDKGNSQQYMAGVISLPFGPSERVASCFWAKAFNHDALNQDMIEECGRKYHLEQNAFGIGGNGDNYLLPAV